LYPGRILIGIPVTHANRVIVPAKKGRFGVRLTMILLPWQQKGQESRQDTNKQERLKRSEPTIQYIKGRLDILQSREEKKTKREG
jgi:hypothetical protein